MFDDTVNFATRCVRSNLYERLKVKQPSLFHTISRQILLFSAQTTKINRQRRNVMSLALVFLLVLIVGIVAAVLYVIAVYNRLVTLRNRFKNAFAQIDVQLKRRYDLIPNLVETAKGYLKHERETLEAVIAARNQAAGAAKQAAATPGNPQAMALLSGAEGALTGALGRLFALAEAYPDLKANQTMMQLSEELTSTENRVAFARQAFNDAIMAYNTAREVFPAVLIAGVFQFSAAALLEIEDSEKTAPRVTFS
jgi:LemA protein